MYAPERQQEILRLARDGGRVDVLSLADEFQVTAETIRRDLKALDRAGLLRRVHGGAIPAGRLDFEPDLAERESTAADEKDRIARTAQGRVRTRAVPDHHAAPADLQRGPYHRGTLP
ncbi:DeoR family transcriptional regulator, partial [Streptomyces sp. NPDC005568]|uniref:DeoR family transcriptional regulator n=1 Tax=Streptomyces sp. NPDC005568 TaxID=3156887 RepID=UPI0033B4D38F